MKRVTFITTGQPTTNPRLVKEAELLSSLGYDVKVICCFYQTWAKDFDRNITEKNPGMYIYCGGEPKRNKLRYHFSRFRQKISRILFRIVAVSPFAEYGASRTHGESLSIAKRLKSDLFIAHNLGALPAAVAAAGYHAAKVGYDAEDMHSGQYASNKDIDYTINKYIEEKYFPQTTYFTAASPLIAAAYEGLYPYLNPLVINNVFPRTRLAFQVRSLAPVRLFWFSQTVGPDRGIEAVVSAIGRLTCPAELHLLGNCSANYKNLIYESAFTNGVGADQVFFYDPIPADQLMPFAAQFDIGLASETGTTINRDICLTNKIFVYLQCGLAIVSSNTLAQALFFQDHLDSGRLYQKDDSTSLAEAIQCYTNDKALFNKVRETNYQLGQRTLNWETEGQKFVEIVKLTLSD